MYLKTLSIKNFRAIEDLYTDFEKRANVIVGPNAIGKTSILEAIRLCKAVLAPRTGSEQNQVLISLGITSPHLPQQFFPAAVARNADKNIEISCTYSLDSTEVDWLRGAIPQIANSVVQANIGQQFANLAAITQYLSSDEGRESLREAEIQVEEALNNLSSQCRLFLVIDPQTGRVQGEYGFEQLLFSALDQRCPPSKTMFSYFPADRALPPGEQPVQFGAPDAAQQLESHNSQPQLKYGRLKNTIFTAVVTSAESRSALYKEFERIFDGVLRGRLLGDVGISASGLLSIRIKDDSADFDIDGMSSGEKGLILTFLLIARSIESGGVILFDEPELHLNPAVCRNLLGFLVENYLIPNNIQAILCSHSPEILAGAFERDDCALYHLVDPNMITAVRHQDHEEISAALKRLGSSEGESLLYSATIFVEGITDVELLLAAFPSLLRRYKLRDLGGRAEVEKYIAALQESERKGSSIGTSYFIFDGDRRSSSLSSTQRVRVKQWKRYCLENYLIDADAIADVLQDPDVAKTPVRNVGEVKKALRELALAQVNELAIREVYERYAFPSVGVRSEDIVRLKLDDSVAKLWTRIKDSQERLVALDESTWKSGFISNVEYRTAELESEWQSCWMEVCNGKRLFDDLRRRIPIKISAERFLLRIVRQLQASHSPSLETLESLLRDMLGLPLG